MIRKDVPPCAVAAGNPVLLCVTAKVQGIRCMNMDLKIRERPLRELRFPGITDWKHF